MVLVFTVAIGARGCLKIRRTVDISRLIGRFTLVYLLLTAGRAAPASEDLLSIQRGLRDHSAVIVGWWHWPGNNLVPDEVYKAIQNNLDQNPVLVVERSSQATIASTVSENNRRLHARVGALGVELVPGGAPVGNSEPGIESNYIAAILRLVREGKKPVLLIGEGHLDSLMKVLSRMGVDAWPVRTEVVVETGAITLEGRPVGYMDPTDPFLLQYRFLKEAVASYEKPPGPVRRLVRRCIAWLESGRSSAHR